MLQYLFRFEEECTTDFIVTDEKLEKNFAVRFPDEKSAHHWFMDRIDLEALYLRSYIEKLEENLKQLSEMKSQIYHRINDCDNFDLVMKLARLSVLELGIGIVNPYITRRMLSYPGMTPPESYLSGELVSNLFIWNRKYEIYLTHIVDDKDKSPVGTILLSPAEALLYNHAKLNPIYSDISDVLDVFCSQE